MCGVGTGLRQTSGCWLVADEMTVPVPRGRVDWGALKPPRLGGKERHGYLISPKMEEPQMSKGRLEAFSDGVFAVIITIMVLNMNVPRGTDFQALKSVVPIFLCYVLSYIYVCIYWNNHHHLLHASEHVTGGILWANLGLLFCLSLAPFSTAWMGENDYAPLPVATYGVMLLSAGIAYSILSKSLIAHHGKTSVLAK